MTVTLKTGTLEVADDPALFDLVDFGSRINRKRGFLFVSKVLGKHLPTRPSVMEATYAQMAAQLPQNLRDLPTLFIGFAETATALGQGVFEAADLPRSFYIHSTRFQTSDPLLLGFCEEHCHAPSHLFYRPRDPALDAMLPQIEHVVLIDDEVSTGNTANNLVSALHAVLPNARHYSLLTILNWMPREQERFSSLCLYRGRFNFTPADLDFTSDVVSEPHAPTDLDSIIPYNFGRFGTGPLDLDFASLTDIAALKAQKVLVLGTAEFMYAPYRFARHLESCGIDVHYQATTRSPVNVDGAITSKLRFKDNYFENIDNFLYNVIDRTYDRIFLCYETTAVPGACQLGAMLRERFAVEELFFDEKTAATSKQLHSIIKV